MVEFSPFSTLIEPDKSLIIPEEIWSESRFCELAALESWNVDEFTEEGYHALTQLFLRLIVPKEHWENISYDKFLKLVKQKYKERLNEEI